MTKSWLVKESSEKGLYELDLSMPDMDGFELLKALRVDFPKLKIVVITSN